MSDTPDRDQSHDNDLEPHVEPIKPQADSLESTAKSDPQEVRPRKIVILSRGR